METTVLPPLSDAPTATEALFDTECSLSLSFDQISLGSSSDEVILVLDTHDDQDQSLSSQDHSQDHSQSQSPLPSPKIQKTPEINIPNPNPPEPAPPAKPILIPSSSYKSERPMSPVFERLRPPSTPFQSGQRARAATTLTRSSTPSQSTLAKRSVDPSKPQFKAEDLETIYIGTYGHVQAHSLHAQPPPMLWSTSLPSSGYYPTTVIEDDGCIFAGVGGKLHKLDASNGDILWEHGSLSWDYIPTSLCLISEMILLGKAGKVIALNKKDGLLLWKNSLFSESNTVIVLEPSKSNDKHLFVASHGVVFCLDLEAKGNKLWTATISPGGPTTLLSYHFDTFVALNGQVIRFDKSGSVVAKTRVGSWSKPVSLLLVEIESQKLLICGTYGEVYALEPDTLRVVWTNTLPGTGYGLVVTLAFTNNQSMLLAGNNGYLVSLAPLTGTLNWKLSLPGSGYDTVSLSFTKNGILAGSKGALYGINRKGVVAWKHVLGLGYQSVFLANNGLISQTQNNQPILQGEEVRPKGR